jgi:hypothetical protein
MSEALISDAELSPREPTEVLRSGAAPNPCRRANGSALLSLPGMRPGQLWYVQFPSTQPALAPFEYRAMTANVVIYDRALASIVAGALPLGGYAELAAVYDRAAERGLRFASEGWSVARLVDPQRGWIDDLRHLSRKRLPALTSTVSPVSVIVNIGDRYKTIEAELSELGDIAASLGLDQPFTMTVIFDGSGSGTAPRFAVASANGLAG